MKVAIVMFLFLTTNAFCQTPQQSTEVKHLEESLLAPCCYSQAVGQHMSGAADDMRKEIAGMVADGKSENEIIDHYKELYGERILIIPDGNTGKILFAMPLAIAALALGIVLLTLRKLLRANQNSGSQWRGKTPHQIPDAFRAEIERQTGSLM